MSWAGTALASAWRHRRRLATPVLGLLLGAVAVSLWPAVPRDTEVELRMGRERAAVREARVEVRQDDALVRAVDLRFGDEGAPEVMRERFALTPGAYRVDLELVLVDGSVRRESARVRAPAGGVLNLRPGGADRGASGGGR